jgi:hypothetical protein
MTEATEHDVAEPVPELDRFSVPHDWAAIDEAVTSAGGAVVEGLLGVRMLDALNDEIDAYLAEHVEAGNSATGSDGYDLFLGHRTIRLHGLIEKLASGADLIGVPELVGWANRHIAGGGESVILNAAELIQIQPGEPAQSSHRDTDSWPVTVADGRPVIVNAIVALDDFTLDNGATYVAPGSWAWDESRQAIDSDWTRAVMDAGDVLLFRGDAVHRGGENTSSVRRRAISVAYCAGWLRPVENSYLNVSPATAAKIDPLVQSVLGYTAFSGTPGATGFLGLYENGDPARFFDNLS